MIEVQSRLNLSKAVAVLKYGDKPGLELRLWYKQLDKRTSPQYYAWRCSGAGNNSFTNAKKARVRAGINLREGTAA